MDNITLEYTTPRRQRSRDTLPAWIDDALAAATARAARETHGGIPVAIILAKTPAGEWTEYAVLHRPVFDALVGE